MEKKALFFDIDMTLWDKRNEIPEDTRWAIRRARELGHEAFICTGRSRGHIQYDRLLSIGWDGFITGCGTLVEYHDETLIDAQIAPDEWERIIAETRKYNIRLILEGKDYLYLDDSEFQGDPYGDKLIKDVGSRRRTIKDEWGKWQAGKFSVDLDPDTDPTGWFKYMDRAYSTIKHNGVVVEIVPKGYDKITGIQAICDRIGIGIEDTVAFGDASNDIQMIKGAGIGVAMGNGSDDAKKAADLVTDDWDKGGISKALIKLGVIDQ